MKKPTEVFNWNDNGLDKRAYPYRKRYPNDRPRQFDGIVVLSIIGTRPEVIKMAPVIAELERFSSRFQSVVCVTGQHCEMLKQALETFRIRPDFNLNVMRPNQSLSLLTARLLESLHSVVEELQPDWILGQGDTTTVFASALTAFYHKIKFGHIEAGLRTNNMWNPFPEEFNRRVTDAITTVWFAPTDRARCNLLAEGFPESDIVLCGNTVVDAMRIILAGQYDWRAGQLSMLPKGTKFVLVTVHRRDNIGEPLERICSALRFIAKNVIDSDTHLVCSVHPNPNIRGRIRDRLSGLDNVTLMEHLDYAFFINVMKRSVLVLTDSGGIQEEAPYLGVPVLIMRDTTERPEGIEAGFSKLVGTDEKTIVVGVKDYLSNRNTDRSKQSAKSLYGDGFSAQRIVAELSRRSSHV